MQTIFLLLLWSAIQVGSVPLSSFYPFGTDAGDDQLHKNAVESTNELTFGGNSFLFYNKSHANVFVSSLGYLIFEVQLQAYSSLGCPFPSANGVPLVAPFGSHIDTRTLGNVYYRYTTNDTAIAQTISVQIARSFPLNPAFYPNVTVIATWDKVGHFDNSANPNITNTFQCVLAANQERSYIMFLYLDDGINWAVPDPVQGEGQLIQVVC
jgi:receptor-type tyrosine-protein phosphatase Q/CUB/sushi domain-containing protein